MLLHSVCARNVFMLAGPSRDPRLENVRRCITLDKTAAAWHSCSASLGETGLEEVPFHAAWSWELFLNMEYSFRTAANLNMPAASAVLTSSLQAWREAERLACLLHRQFVTLSSEGIQAIPETTISDGQQTFCIFQLLCTQHSRTPNLLAS